ANLAERAGKEPVEVPIFVDYQDDVFEAVKTEAEEKLSNIYQIADKQQRETADAEYKAELIEKLAGEGKPFEGREDEIGKALSSVTKQVIR
ncbi:polyribonucleotide nucleotidyltransferase, partial [Nitrospinae bacterium AH_259_B05_G02_I21]|nr:polyribonucleotide nucleotidyltransferase [Nitrospinae bacterium AH_259_B05_G02_I21]